MLLNPHGRIFKTVNARLDFQQRFAKKAFLDSWGADTRPSSSLIPFGMRGYNESKDKTTAGQTKYTPKCSETLTIAVIEGMPSQDRLQRALIESVSTATGCRVEIRFLEMGEYVKAQYSRRFDIYVHGLDTNSNDPLEFYRDFRPGVPENFLKLDDLAFGRAFEKAYYIPQEQRSQEVYAAIAKAIDETNVVLVLGHPQFSFVFRKEVRSMHMNPLGMHLNRWWLIGRK